jgi:hypothetical protein
MSDVEEAVKAAREKVQRFLDQLVDADLLGEWSKAATELYKEQFAKKQNPYGEAWQYRPGDEKRTKSYYKFGRVVDVDRDGFTLAVAGPNAKRSCVPFEPRGLGAWRPKFNEILQKKARLLFRNVRP